MLAIAEIKSWLSSDRDYQSGLIILKRYSKSPLVNLLDRGEDPFNRKKLAQLLLSELEKFETLVPLQPIIPEKKQIKPLESPNVSKKIISLSAERKALYVEVNHLKSKTLNTPEGDGLKELAFEILKRWNRIDEIWAITDHYNETGELPEDAKDKLVEKYNDPLFLKQQQNNLRSNISKIARKIKSAGADVKRIDELIERKKKFEDELKVVESKLSDHAK